MRAQWDSFKQNTDTLPVIKQLNLSPLEVDPQSECVLIAEVLM